MKIIVLLQILLVLELSEAMCKTYTLTVSESELKLCPQNTLSNCYSFVYKSVSEEDDDDSSTTVIPPNVLNLLKGSFECEPSITTNKDRNSSTHSNTGLVFTVCLPASNLTHPITPTTRTGSTTGIDRNIFTSSNTTQQGLGTTVGLPTSNPTPTSLLPCSSSATNPYTTPAALGAIIGVLAVLLIIVLVGWMLTCCLAFKIRGVRDKNKTDIR